MKDKRRRLLTLLFGLPMRLCVSQEQLPKYRNVTVSYTSHVTLHVTHPSFGIVAARKHVSAAVHYGSAEGRCGSLLSGARATQCCGVAGCPPSPSAGGVVPCGQRRGLCEWESCRCLLNCWQELCRVMKDVRRTSFMWNQHRYPKV